MMIGTMQKAGYFLIGMSGGLLVSTLLYDRELRRAVGEIEEYIPKKDRPVEAIKDIAKDVADSIDDAVDTISEKIEDIVEDVNYSSTVKNKIDAIDEKIEDLVSKANDRRKDSAEKTNYSVMFKNKKDIPINKVVNSSISDYDMDDLEDYDYEEDIPSDDEIVEDDRIDDDLVRERVEEWIEVYLDENPQDFITLVYYQEDMTLCDDREQLISNPEEVIGTVAIDRLIDKGPGAENGSIFVRNLKTMINYEVVLDTGAYSETVLGIFEERLDKGDGGDVKR